MSSQFNESTNDFKIGSQADSWSEKLDLTDRPLLRDRLNADLEAVHDRVESIELYRRLFNDNLTVEQYVETLVVLQATYSFSESVCKNSNSLATMLKPIELAKRIRSELARDDLIFFENLGFSIPSYTKRQLGIESVSIERLNPFFLLGMLYVTEGQTNGSQYAATNVFKVMSNLLPSANINGECGISFLDEATTEKVNGPRGRLDNPNWDQFKMIVNSIQYDELQYQAALRGAHVMYALTERAAENVSLSHGSTEK